MAEQRVPVLLTCEPTDGPVGWLLRQILSGRVVYQLGEGLSSPPDEAVLALLFAADRMDHLNKKVLPGLEAGVHVVSDRYYLSSFAYQTISQGMELGWVRQVNARCLRPDLTIYLDVSPAECHRRMVAQGRQLELFEDLSKLEQVHRNYLHVIKVLSQEGENIQIVDGELAVAEVAARVARVAQATLALPEIYKPG